MPAARAIWSGSISFGLVNIPVKVYTATDTKDVSFTTLHATCRTPLKRPYMCPVDNVPVESKEMVKGYPVGKTQYVILTDDEMLADLAATGLRLLRWIDQRHRWLAAALL